MSKLKTFSKHFFILLLFLLSFSFVQAKTNYNCLVYFTGVGCPHCAKTDPFVLEKSLQENPDLIIFEYEIYQNRENGPLLFSYYNNYHSSLGIPQLIFNKNKKIIGDRPILSSFTQSLKESQGNPCPLINGSSSNFEDLNLNLLPGKVKIWRGNRIIIKGEEKVDSQVLKNLLLSSEIEKIISQQNYQKVEPVVVALSGKNIHFNNAIKIKDWLFQWNEKEKKVNSSQNLNLTYSNQKPSKDKQELQESTAKQDLTLAKLVSLAVVDAINPCALAVLTLMLLAILTYNPTKRRNVLLAGLAFALSVFVMYFLYGIIIIKFFQFIQKIALIKLWLYKILGGAAIILGILNIRDFIHYRPGGFLTEMPLFLRPKVKKIISGITSPQGAFIVGLFVTLFLLPCTIGPYVIAGGILSTKAFLKCLPCLFLYNLIFILPMIAITLIVYLGTKRIEEVSEWKDKNIRYLHLIAGIIILVLGVGLLIGIF